MCVWCGHCVVCAVCDLQHYYTTSFSVRVTVSVYGWWLADSTRCNGFVYSLSLSPALTVSVILSLGRHTRIHITHTHTHTHTRCRTLITHRLHRRSQVAATRTVSGVFSNWLTFDAVSLSGRVSLALSLQSICHTLTLTHTHTVTHTNTDTHTIQTLTLWLKWHTRTHLT